jgi:biotin carboxylase
MRILLLSTTTGYQLRSFTDAARDLGVEIVYATDRCHALEDPWRDAAVPVRFHEEEASLQAITALAGDRPLDGVIAVGDRPVVLAARVAEALRLPGNPPQAARASGNKRLARERLNAAGLPGPAFVAAAASDDIDRLLPSVDYPAVVKPVGLSGSRGVMRVDSAGELRIAIARLSRLLARPEVRAQRTGAEGDLLIERFVPGEEYAVEGVITDGTFTPLAIFDKPDPLDGPFFEETVYVTPSRAPSAVQQEIVGTVARAVHALGLRHGPLHAECRVNPAGVFMLEAAARPIGGLCSRVLRFGKDETRSLEHVLLQHACGGGVEGARPAARAAAVMMMPIPRRGVFRGVQGEAAARAVPLVEDIQITARPDQLIEPLPEAGGYLGFIFARGPCPGDVEGAVRLAHSRMRVLIDPAIPVMAHVDPNRS